MKSIIDIAKGVAAQREWELSQKRSTESGRRLGVLSRGVLAGVGKLEKQKCRYGVFHTVPGMPTRELSRVSCTRSDSVVLPVAVIYGSVYREKPVLLATVYDPEGSSVEVSTEEVAGIVSLGGFFEKLGKALSSWY